MSELLAPKDPAPEFPAPRTLQDLDYVVRRELSYSIQDIPKPLQEPSISDAGSLTDLPAMVENGLRHATETGITNIPVHAREYWTHYGAERVADPSLVRCHNHAYDACRAFSRYGMPMHLLALAPPIRHFLSVDWHVMAFCPLADRRDGARAILAFENGTPLLWRHGDLAAFVAWHEQDHPEDRRRWIPWKGIARFREPEHPVAHRLLMHVGHAVTEEHMETLTLDALTTEKMPMLA